MKIDPNLIGFDIDGVVADTTEAFIRILGGEYGIIGIADTDITEFDVSKCLDIDPQIIEEAFGYLLHSPIEVNLKPMPDAVMVLSEMSRQAPLTFITARPNREPIAAWLKHVLGPQAFKQVRLIAMGDHDGKPEYIKQLGLQYFIDDRYQTCMSLDQHGVTPFVFCQPWNQGRHQLRSVASWLEIRDLCL